MTEVRWVVVSDVHLGAANSVLSPVRPDGTVDAACAAPMIDALVDCFVWIRQLNGDGPPPTLVLAGDVLDLALSTDDTTGAVFERFVAALVAPAERPVASTIWLVPGNHDHHLWELSRETRYLDALRAAPKGQAPPPPAHITPLFHDDTDPFRSALLTTLAKRQTGGQDLEVRVAYPDLALRGPNGRVVVIDHGHYTEPAYRLVSRISDLAFPNRDPVMTRERIENENYAWVDFFWSTLGRSGAAGTDIGRGYELLQSDPGLTLLGHRIAHDLGKTYVQRLVLEGAVRVAMGMMSRHAAQMERQKLDVLLSPSSEGGLFSYLAALSSDLRDSPYGLPDELTFIFGHTHKPFTNVQHSVAAKSITRVMNTGGWVVDTLRPATTHGAAIVVLDDQLDAASLRVYQQSIGGPTRVWVEPAAVSADATPFSRQLAAALEPAAAPWSTFAIAAHDAVAHRRRHLEADIADTERRLRGR